MQIEELPEEIITEVFSYLGLQDLINCGQVSKKINSISQIETLWHKFNLFRKAVPTKFLEMIIQKGCKYLNLSGARLEGNLSLAKASQLRL